MRNFLPFIAIGLANGAIYGLFATGLVLTYKTSGIFNFGQGAIATVAAYVFYFLHVDHGMPWVPAMVISVAVLGPVIGIAMEPFAARLSTQANRAQDRRNDRSGAARASPGDDQVRIADIARGAVPSAREGHVPALRRRDQLRQSHRRGDLVGSCGRTLGPVSIHPSRHRDAGRRRRSAARIDAGDEPGRDPPYRVDHRCDVCGAVGRSLHVVHRRRQHRADLPGRAGGRRGRHRLLREPPAHLRRGALPRGGGGTFEEVRAERLVARRASRMRCRSSSCSRRCS